MSQPMEERKGKKLYVVPQLTTISLRPEEAVLGACKSLNTGGSHGGSCLIPLGGCITSNAGS
jgi:hypothetical protein